MGNGSPDRRLAAIVAIDVVGYSRLMGADEVGTLTVLKSHQDILTPMVEEHGGRLVSTAGDGFLLEFPSVIEALNCAIEIQDVMKKRNEAVPDDKQMLLRIGINLGDIIVHTDDDVFGDGVNVAARIEQLAPPGGICISRSVRSQVRDKMDVNLEDMGEIEVKNIARPIRVFRVLKEGEVASTPSRTTPAWQRYAAMAAVVLALMAGGAGWWWSQQPDFEPADPAKYAFTIPDKPSIAVLPFDNLTGDESQDYLADGLTENIIAVLAGTPEIFVIARNSSFAYKGKPTKVQEIAEQLGVRYILEGSIQKDGNKLRVTAQLIDALNGRHLWADRFDVELTNLFELQDIIAQKISNQMEVKLTIGEQASRWKDLLKEPESYELFVKGRVRFQTYSPEGNKDAERLWRELYENMENKNIAKVSLAYAYLQRIWIRISEDPKKDFAIAKKLTEEALSEEPEMPRNHMMMSWINRAEGKFDAATKNIDDALRLNPGGSDEHLIGGALKVIAGQPEQGVLLLEKGMRLEPDFPHYAIYTLAVGYRMIGDLQKSKTISKASLEKKSDDQQLRLNAYLNLTTIAVIEDDLVLAKNYVKALLSEYPTYSIAFLERVRRKYKNQKSFNNLINALRIAGLPENQPVKAPDEPAIALLPLKNISGNPDQDILVAGLTEDLNSALSRVPELLVISQYTMRQYSEKQSDILQIAQELDVSHILEGTVQRSEDRLRVTMRLVDGASGVTTWSQRYDRNIAEFFNLQDEIVNKVLVALQVELIHGETAREMSQGTKSLEAWLLYVRGSAEMFKFDREANITARNLFQDAADIDPDWAYPLTGLAWSYREAIRFGWSTSADADRERGIKLALTAIEMAPNDPIGYITLGNLYIDNGQIEEGIALREKAIELSPNHFYALAGLAWHLNFTGEQKRALDLYARAKRINPLHPHWLISGEAFALLVDGQPEKSIVTYQKAIGIKDMDLLHGRIAAAYAEAEQFDKAREHTRILLERKPDATIPYLTKIIRFRDPKLNEWYAGLLRKADVPEGTE